MHWIDLFFLPRVLPGLSPLLGFRDARFFPSHPLHGNRWPPPRQSDTIFFPLQRGLSPFPEEVPSPPRLNLSLFRSPPSRYWRPSFFHSVDSPERKVVSFLNDFLSLTETGSPDRPPPSPGIMTASPLPSLRLAPPSSPPASPRPREAS